MSLFSTVVTEPCPDLEHCCNLSQILLLLQLLLAILSWAGHLSLKSQLKYPLVLLIFTHLSGCFQKQFKYSILKIQ